MELLLLFAEFFKTGLFALGGGLATLPFLYNIADRYDWFTRDMIPDMLAISESTPGPIGVNMATYVGFTAGSTTELGLFCSILGAVIATIGLITPSIIIVLIIAGILNKFKENRFVNSAFYGIRPAAVALVISALIFLCGTVFLNLPADIADFSLKESVNWLALAIGASIFALSNIKPLKKLHPIAFIGLGAVCGIVFGL